MRGPMRAGGAAQASAKRPQPRRGGRRVAVVDDDRSVRTALCRLLEALGFAVDSYDSGESFLAGLSGPAPHCLVLDLQMPGMTGIDLQHRLTALGVAVPVVVISGQDGAALHARCRAAGAAACLTKPLDAGALLRAIERAIEGRPSRG